MSNHNSLFLELQKDVLNSSISVIDIMRKANWIAKKLNAKDFQGWISSELQGYSQKNLVPSYRIVKGTIRYWNQFHGWQPIIIKGLTSDEENMLCTRYLREPLSHFVELSKDNSNYFHIEFPTSAKELIMEWVKTEVDPVLQISKLSIIGIVESVKDHILDWTFHFDQDYSLNKEINFAYDEKQVTSGHSYQFVFNMNQSQKQDNSSIDKSTSIQAGRDAIGNIGNSQVSGSITNTIKSYQDINTDLIDVIQAITELRKEANTLTADRQSIANAAIGDIEVAVTNPTQIEKAKSALWTLWGVGQGVATFTNAVTAVAERFGVHFS